LIGLLSIILVIGTIFGDLFFSLLKRKNGIKNFAETLPGHGGFLDRMDSYICVVAIFGIITLIISFVTAIHN
jgi:phosphatidate cytidylyltransferase